MSFIIMAPTPLHEEIVTLPNPRFEDGQSITSTGTINRTMDGTIYTHVRRQDNEKSYSWTFWLTRPKQLELLTFVQTYIAERWKIIDHDENIIVGFLSTSPVEFAKDRRAANCLGNDLLIVDLEFVGTIE